MIPVFLTNERVEAVLTALTVFFGTLLVLIAARFTLRNLLRRSSIGFRGKSYLIRALEQSTLLFLVTLSLVHAIPYASLPATVVRTVDFVLLSIIVFFVINIIDDFFLGVIRYQVRKKVPNERAVDNISKNLGILTHLILIIAGIVFLLDNLGFNVTSLVAGLGVGGIAIALAAQSILGDAFSSMIIYIDRPFEIGDFITFNNFLGTVESVGFKTTRIRSLSGELLVVPNTKLTSTELRNYKRLVERRVTFEVGIAYETPIPLLKEVSKRIRERILALPNVRLDRAHFFRFGESSLIYEVVYFVLSDDYNLYMDIQQELNVALMEEFSALKVEFAYPTRTVFLRSEASPQTEEPRAESSLPRSRSSASAPSRPTST